MKRWRSGSLESRVEFGECNRKKGSFLVVVIVEIRTQQNKRPHVVQGIVGFRAGKREFLAGLRSGLLGGYLWRMPPPPPLRSSQKINRSTILPPTLLLFIEWS